MQTTKALNQLSTKEVVDAAYRGILQRVPDEGGLNTYADRLEKHGLVPVINGLIRSPEFRRRYLIDATMRDGKTAAAITSYIVHLRMHTCLHQPRLDLVQNYIPAGAKVLDLGGASEKPEGALIQMGYSHAKDLTIVDLPLDIRFKQGAHVDSEFEHNGTLIRYAYHSMADLDHYPDNCFDLIWSGQTYEHISRDEGIALFPQIARVLKPGGVFAMDTPNRKLTRLTVGDDEWIHAEHKYEWDYCEFVDAFAGKGLKLIDQRGILAMPDSLKYGHAVLGELEGAAVNDTPDNSYCFYLAYQKPL